MIASNLRCWKQHSLLLVEQSLSLLAAVTVLHSSSHAMCCTSYQQSTEYSRPNCQFEVIIQVPRRRFSSRQRTSRYMGVGSSNRKNQWQARILVHGKVTHLGYYETEEDAAKVYDRVSISLHGEAAQTNFPQGQYQGEDSREYSGLDREDLQRALGVKPMDKSSKSASSPYPCCLPLPTAAVRHSQLVSATPTLCSSSHPAFTLW